MSEYPDIYYTSGRCHLFALVLAELTNTNVTVWWDADALDENLDPIGEFCLIHAVVMNQANQAMDVEGVGVTPDEYEFNELKEEQFGAVEFARIIANKEWPLFEPGERKHIEKRIESIHGISSKKIALNTDNSALSCDSSYP